MVVVLKGIGKWKGKDRQIVEWTEKEFNGRLTELKVAPMCLQRVILSLRI